VQLCDRLSPAPDVTFHGPVDGALHPAATAELLDLLVDALVLIGRHWAPSRSTSPPPTAGTSPRPGPCRCRMRCKRKKPDQVFTGLRDRAGQAGMRIEIEPGPELVQILSHAV
jgi:hypothetical protein